MDLLLDVLRNNPQLAEQYASMLHRNPWSNSNSLASSPFSSAVTTPDFTVRDVEDSVFTFPTRNESSNCTTTSSDRDRTMSTSSYNDVEVDVQRILFGCRENVQEYSRKVFVGGLPNNVGNATVTTEQLERVFSKYGRVTIDWPHRDGYQIGPTGGYAFAIFSGSEQVPALLRDCKSHNGKLSLYVRLGIHHKLVQIRPWANSNRYWTASGMHAEDIKQYERFSIFLGGVPRTATAGELARLMIDALGNVIQVQVETDLETDYPKGAARIIFASKEAYISAVARRVICFRTPDGQKEMEMKPYLDGHFKCDCCGQPWRHFCAELRCLKYLCEGCWPTVHVGLDSHRPMVRGTYHVRLQKTRDPSAAIGNLNLNNRMALPNLLDITYPPRHPFSPIYDQQTMMPNNGKGLTRGPRMQIPSNNDRPNFAPPMNMPNFHSFNPFR